MAPKAKDMTGLRFGRLVVTERRGSRGKSAAWAVVCDCGAENVVTRGNLICGHARSCGCLRDEGSSKRLKELAGRIHKSRGCKGGLARELRGYKRAARKRGLEWSLTDEEASLMMTSACHYCGTSPSIPTDVVSLNKVWRRGGIDRVVNSSGYGLLNCVPCCFACNRAKATMSQADFLSWVSRIAQHQGFTTYNPPPIQEDQSMKWTVM